MRWADAGRPVREIVLKRRVAVMPRAEVPVEMAVAMHGEGGWADAAQGELFAWEVRNGEAQEREPEWEMVADGERVYVRVRVEGATGSGDVLNVEWQTAGVKEVERARVVPFGGKGVEVWHNQKQSVEMKGVVEPLAEGYVVTCALPREWVFGGGKEARLNISLSRTSEDGGVSVRSWAAERGAGDSSGGLGLVALKDKP